MLLKEINADVQDLHEDVQWSQGMRYPGLHQTELTLTMRFVVEESDGPDVPMPMSPQSVIELIQGCKVPQGLTDSSSESSAQPKPPIIVVSLRPDIDGSPSFSMSMVPGSTQVLPLDLAAITPKGELVRLAVPIEIRASVH